MSPLFLSLGIFLGLYAFESRTEGPKDQLRAFLHAAYFFINSSTVLLFALYFLPETFHVHPTRFTALPETLQFLSILFVLDFSAYWMHRLSHTLPYLWRFHQVHHSDDRLDASTGFRLHVVQVVVGLLPELAFIYLFRPSARSYLAYVLLAQAIVLLHHSKIFLPWAEKHLSAFLVLRPFHGMHHENKEGSFSNFGSVFSFWDRFFGTATQAKKVNQFGLTEVYNPFTWKELFFPPVRGKT